MRHFKRNTNWAFVGYAALILALVSFGIFYTVFVWNECRETNSFFYCLRIISR